NDLGWYFIYFIIGFPFIISIFVILSNKIFKNKLNNYKKIILSHLVVLILVYIFFIFYLYYLVVNAFQDSGFPF
ncbi:MAG: hypothetical protein ABIA02_02310, partial [Candidatus Falkowbacteria bacterium]